MVIHDKHTNNFSFKVYRKPTNAENYIHYYSNHAIQIKRNIVTNMYMRALKICDAHHLEAEFTHIKDAFTKLGYPQFFLNQCLSKAKQNFYIPKNTNEKKEAYRLTLPFSNQLLDIQKAIKVANKDTHEQSVELTFNYNNTIRSRLVKNRSREEKDDIGVYCLPCLECPASYLGETGRGLSTRIDEHKNACRLGKNYSAVATHSLDVGHRIGFREAEIVYKCQNRNIRRLAEGALISLNNTFDRNSSTTKENKIINSLICQSLNIRNYSNIKATLCTSAAFPHYPQVNRVPAASSGTIDAGRDPANEDQRIPPEPPDPVENNTNLRRSERIRARNNPNR